MTCGRVSSTGLRIANWLAMFQVLQSNGQRFKGECNALRDQNGSQCLGIASLSLGCHEQSAQGRKCLAQRHVEGE